MVPKTGLLTGSFVALMATLGLAQTALYVSPTGNDANAGTAAKPLRTPVAALSRVATSPSQAVTIYLKGGTYYLDAPLVIQPEQVINKTLTIAAEPGQIVRLSAGRSLKTIWTPCKNGIWQTPVAGPVFEQLFINGQKAVLARYPNYDSTAHIYNGTSADALSPQRIARWAHPEGGYVHALHKSEWGDFHYRITGVNNGELQLTGGWQNNRPAPMHAEHRFVENIFEELDAPGEWFYDRQKQTLYVYPRSGTDLKKATVEVSNLKSLIDLRGTPQIPLRNVTIRDIQFVQTERTFMEHYEPLVRSDWTVYRGGAVVLTNTEQCTIADCEFTQLGGNAVMVSGRNKAAVVSGAHIHHIGSSAICFIGDSSAVRSPAFRYEDFVPYAKMDKTPGPKSDTYPVDCRADGNLIHDIGQVEKQVTGVEIEMASAIHVGHNTIFRVPRAGINIGDGAWGGHVIEYNDVFETVLETGDHGAFNSWGRDRFWHPDRAAMDSLTTAHPELILLDAQRVTVLRNNRFRCDHGWDIDLDDGSSNYLIIDNLCLNGGIKLREGFHRTVENNIMVNNSFHPHVWFAKSADVFRHNIVMRPYAPIGIKNWGDSVDNNLFSDGPALEMAQKRGTDAHSRAGDAQFTNPGTGNFSVRSTSPALAVGFRNFPMDGFGVQSPALKKLVPSRPEPVLLNGAMEASVTEITWLGASIRNVNGPGDRSAYGLPDEKGVVVVTVPAGSLLAKSSVKAGDVILTANAEPASNVVRLMAIQQQINWQGRMTVEVMRNQQTSKTTVPLR